MPPARERVQSVPWQEAEPEVGPMSVAVAEGARGSLGGCEIRGTGCRVGEVVVDGVEVGPVGTIGGFAFSVAGGAGSGGLALFSGDRNII